ncbi:MAG: amino acid adenylation domain-containing protein, partial [Granulosicoccus sp.]|nr:amino acid adenylation domain-containing protein [Granulosicoccus sp.]
DLFEASTIERMAVNFECLLAGIVAEPGCRVSHLPLLSDVERQLLLTEWNTSPDQTDERCIHTLFEAQVERTPEAIAVCAGDQRMTYAQLNVQANRLAHYLIGQGLELESTVGICVERSVEMIVSLLAVLKAGGCYVPLDPAYPTQRLAFMLEDVAASFILTQAHLHSVLDPLSGSRPLHRLCVDADTANWHSASESNPERGAGAQNLAYIMYTSGSSGEPKGVAVVHQGVVRLVRDTNYMVFDATQVFLQLAPLSFDASTFEIWGALLNGARLQIMPPETPSLASLGEAIREKGVTTLWLTSGLFTLMVDEQLSDLASLRYLLSGGDVLSVAHVDKAYKALPGTQIINAYGPTENTTFSCCHAITEVPKAGQSIPIGRPIAHTQVYLLDSRQLLVPCGVVGELYVGGAGLARQYLNQPKLSAERFIDNPFAPGRLYRTGDQARWREDGTIEFLGRLDTQVKHNGFRIELSEIEAVLKSHPSVSDCVVVASGQGNDKVLVAYVVAQEAPGSARLRHYLGERLPHYMVPSLYVPLDAIPLTSIGKVDRRALPAPDRNARAASESRELETEDAQALAAIWSTLLGVQRVGPDDNFFELGGHSLLAIQVLSRIREAFSVEIPLKWLFESPTVGSLSARIDALRSASAPVKASAPVALARRGTVMLSHAQERLWFLDQLEGASALYNMPYALHLRGALQVEALERALQQIVQRHEVLRTAIVSGPEGIPKQQVTQEALVLHRVSVQGRNEVCDDAIKRLVSEERERAFDLRAALKIRATLVTVNREAEGASAGQSAEYLLLITLHHIASDGWSMGVFREELGRLYNGYRAGESASLAPLPLQYADFAAWQRQWFDEAQMDKQLEYWRVQLSGAPELLELPHDHGRLAKPEIAGDRCGISIDIELCSQLRLLSVNHKTTLFNTLFSAFTILLGRLADQDDVLVGIPSAGRHRRELEELIGFFINTLVIRTDLSGNPTFSAVLDGVRERTLEAFENQDVPFEKLVEVLKPARDMNRHPLFQVMFNQVPEQSDLILQDLEVAPWRHAGALSKFDLTVYVKVGYDTIDFQAVFDSSLFTRKRIESMLDEYRSLLEQVARESNRPISDYSLLTPAARPLVPDLGKEIDEPVFESVPAQIAYWAQQAPDKLAISTIRCKWNYRALVSATNRISGILVEYGVGRGDVVAIWASSRAELVASMSGVWQIGAVVFLLDPGLPVNRLKQQIRGADAGFVLCYEDTKNLHWLNDGRERRATLIMVDIETADVAASPDIEHAVLSKDDPAYIFFTSGSAGEPKGILGTHQGLSHFLAWQSSEFTVCETDRVAQLTAPSFDVILRSTLLALVNGGVLVLPDQVDALDSDYLLRWLQQEQITLLHTVPSLAHSWLINGNQGIELPALRCVFFAGEPLPGKLINDWRAAFPGSGEIVNLYGPTETTMAKSFYRVPHEPASGVQPIGSSLPQTQIAVVRNGHQCGIGESGEIVIRTPYRTCGYIGNSQAFVVNPWTNESTDQLYFTGDVGRVSPDGLVDILGRLDYQIKLRGNRIELEELESVLKQHESIANAAVGCRGEDTDKRLVAYLVLKPDPVSHEKLPLPDRVGELRNLLAREVPAYMVPASFVELETLPLTASGKLDRRALAQIDKAEIRSSVEYLAPQSAVEITLVKIWEEILRRDGIGIDDDFFHLGGHSLMAIRVISRIREAFSVEIPLKWLFESPTVSSLAARIDAWQYQVA